MAPANVLTWFADSSVPHDVRSDAASVRAVQGSVLPDSGMRPLPFDQGNALLPLGIWGPSASNYSLLDDSVITFNLSGGGGGKKKKVDAVSARRSLKRAGFSYAAETVADPVALQLRVESAQKTLEKNPSTSLAIVLTADWRVVGEHISKHPEKLLLVTQAVAKVSNEMRFLKSVGSAVKKSESVVIAEHKKAMCAKKGVCASYNEGQSVATVEPGKGNVAARISVGDLRLTPTVAFVAAMVRGLGLRITDATVLVVDGKEVADKSALLLLAALSQRAASARSRPRPASTSTAIRAASRKQ